MSIRVMSKVWEDAPYSLGTLLVLLALADWADDDGNCWPKLSQLARKTRQDERNVRRCMRVLEMDGAISVVKESAGPGQPREYLVGGTYLPPLGGTKTTERGDKNDSVIRKNRYKPSVNPQTPFFSKSKSKPKNLVEPDAALICDHCGKTGAFQFGNETLCPRCVGRVPKEKP